MHNGRPLTLIGAIFALVGLILLGVTLALAASTASFLASAQRTEGTVTGLTPRTTTSRDSDGYTRRSTTWYPTVEFTVDGRRYSFQSSTGNNPPAYRQGEGVPVAYDPDDPSDARISTFWSAYLAPVITGGLGVVFASIGTIVFVLGRRSAKR
ncbi:DUF3592 domain-containing protein [Nonomuraea bangladeshensis]|uniref:DUF3592 domain-containing protein n=1 Tax=Nonomuraea bangladeshensis TaxID=404385 RepID=A0ABV3HCC5_9ACTN